MKQIGTNEKQGRVPRVQAVVRRAWAVAPPQYFDKGEGYSNADWGEAFVREVFTRGKTVHERGMLQYIQYLSDDEILRRIRDKEEPPPADPAPPADDIAGENGGTPTAMDERPANGTSGPDMNGSHP